MAPTNAQPAQSKIPKFDEALPVQSHVKKRHGKIIMNPKPEIIIGASTLDPAAEESYSGQLVVHNEIPGDRKNKLNDLPKYVMKFLSQCKALMEQNYDEGAKDIDDDEGLLSHNDSAINNSIQHPTETATTHALSANAEVDEFDAISINKRPLKKKKAKDQNSFELPADGESASGGPQLKRTNEQAKSGPRNLIPAYDGDDLYDDDLEFGVDSNKQPEDKVNRKTYYTSVNSSSCKSIIEDYAASTEVYNNCSEPVEATTLSPGQWKVLMDMLNERAPCPTTKRPTTWKKSTKEPTTVCSTSMAANGNGRMTPKQQQETSTEPKPTKAKQRVQTAKTTCGTSLTPCASTSTRTTTCSTTTCSTTTCSRRTHATTTIEPCDNTEIEATTEDCSETTVLRNIKQKNKPVIPQRYFIKVENPKPKLHKEALLQGRSKANNWLDNIKNMKLLESLRLNQNPMKPSFVLNPKSANPGGQNDPDGAERMLAEGVIPLKTGSTLNLYISYVLNKTKANKGKAGQEHKVPEEVDQQEPT